MKTKIAILFVGVVASCLTACAQTDTPAPADATTNSTTPDAVVESTAVAQSNTAEDAAAPAQEQTVAADTATAAPATDAATNETAATETSTNETEEVTTNTTEQAAAPTEPATNENDMAETSTVSEDGSASTNAAVIPLIVMDDVPLTDAIKNLARQAGINYMLDPKIAYGQPGPDGRIVPQPSVSIRWENITAQQALYALLNNYDLRLEEDPKTHISRVTKVNPAAPPPLTTQIIQLQYANPSNIVKAVETIIGEDKRSKVVPDIRTSQLVVVATEKQMDAISKMITKLDTQTKQVLIEARLLETSINPTTIKGINWSGTLQAQNLAFGNNLQKNVPTESINNTLSETFPKMLVDTAHGFNPATAFLDADGVNAVLSFINQNSEAKVLSEPRTVTLDNETAHIEVGQDYPIINVTASTANTTGGSQITYSNLTVNLDVTPRISANSYINLKVSPRVMRLDHVQTFVVGGTPFDVPIFDTRTMNTSVMIPSGNTLVMGGLVQDNESINSTKVPVLGDIPLLGHAFRSKEKNRLKSNLLVFITPTIVQDSDFQPTKTDYLQTPLPKPDDSKWSKLDTTEPLDWSKPIADQFNKEKPEPVYQPVNLN